MSNTTTYTGEHLVHADGGQSALTVWAAPLTTSIGDTLSAW